MLKKIIIAAALVCVAAGAQAAVVGRPLEYRSGKDVMMGYVAYDNAVQTPRPAILVVPDWMGMSPFARAKAEQLAREGYVAMAVDVYGMNSAPENQQQAADQSGRLKANRPLLQAHMKAAYDALLKLKRVDPTKIVVMGYCFGGTSALELARTGAPLVGTATFHGGLSNPTPENAKNIKGKVLVMHGAEDPHVPPAEVAAFKDEMKAAGVDMKFISYPGAVHAFAVPTAGNDKSTGAAYNAEADKASWADFEAFLKQVM